MNQGHEYFARQEEEISNKYMSANGNNGKSNNTTNEVLKGFSLGMLVLIGGALYLIAKHSIAKD